MQTWIKSYNVNNNMPQHEWNPAWDQHTKEMKTPHASNNTTKRHQVCSVAVRFAWLIATQPNQNPFLLH